MSEFERRLWAELDALPEDEARKRIELGHYRDKEARYAREWLRQKDQARSDATNIEQRSLASRAATAAEEAAVAAKSAAAAAWEQARIAKRALITANVALVISIISIIVAVIGPYLRS